MINIAFGICSLKIKAQVNAPVNINPYQYLPFMSIAYLN
jgi:hypothetical protein